MSSFLELSIYSKSVTRSKERVFTTFMLCFHRIFLVEG
uniref:Uncharacterized protein n=1 Tax=Setaria viridis TaxID=4556 RepID=A0A4U6TW69_SETVI|nr:hypothetical protein SEVIR_7G206550v2 [Setaria viridis]